MKKPKPGQDVIIKWIDSGLSQTGDPKDKEIGVLALCETHGRVISCERADLKVNNGTDTTTLKLATNHSAELCKDRTDVDIFSIWWPSVMGVRVWPE